MHIFSVKSFQHFEGWQYIFKKVIHPRRIVLVKNPGVTLKKLGFRVIPKVDRTLVQKIHTLVRKRKIK